jgi:hypothetical protein
MAGFRKLRKREGNVTVCMDFSILQLTLTGLLFSRYVSLLSISDCKSFILLYVSMPTKLRNFEYVCIYRSTHVNGSAH